MPGKCGSCGVEEATKQCTRCKKTYYCNADCQKADWKAHKGGCHEPLAPPKVYEVKCAGCGGYGEGLVGDNGKCAHCTRMA